MPASRLVFAPFIVLGSSAVTLGGKFVGLSSLPVQIVHNTSVQRKERHQIQKTPSIRAIAEAYEVTGKATDSALYTQPDVNTEPFKKRLCDKERELQTNLAALEGEARASGEVEVRDSLDEATSSQGTSESFEEGTFVSQTLEQVRDALHHLQDGS